MEEVDKIILFTLKSLQCDIEEEISSVKSLSIEIFVEAVVKMIQIMDPTFEISQSLPSSMSAKYKYCAELSEKVKSLGFQGDIGYQTFLYGSEIEVRRTLMYLIERLPREQTKISSHETKLDAIKKKLSQAISNELATAKRNKFLSVSLETGIVKPGQIKNKMSPREWKEYCINHLKFITHQTNTQYILPSIITLNSIDWNEPVEPIPFPVLEDDRDEVVQEIDIQSNSITRDISQSDLDKLSQNIQSELDEFSMLKKQYKTLEKLKAEEELLLAKQEKDKDINVKLIIMLPEADEYIVKLESKIRAAHEKMELLKEQWEDHKKPYIEEKKKKSIKQNHTSIHYQQLKELRETAESLKKEYEIKINALNKLNENLPKKSINRTSYTKRILEIINNIKKQDSDIVKIITDTKQIQKQLNNVNGKIERCFTLADEMIFRDASRDEFARKAYKYLVSLHTDCSDIVKVVTEIGNLKKEIKNLEEQIDILCAKNISENFQQIQRDIQHMKNESNSLVQQIESSN